MERYSSQLLLSAFSRLARVARPLSLTLLLGGSIAYAAPYPEEGRAISWQTDDGTTLELRVFGDEFHGRTETLDGHTVVFDNEQNQYYYAELNEDASGFAPTPLRVGKDAAPAQSQNLRLSPDTIRTIAREKRQEMVPEADARWREKVSNAQARRDRQDNGDGPQFSNIPETLGDFVGLTIIVQFPDDTSTSQNDPTIFPTTQAKVESLCNELGYAQDGNTNSVRGYFSDQSLGRLDFTQKVTEIVTLPQPRDFYNFSDFPTKNTIRGAGDAGRTLLADAIAVLQSNNFDFSGLSLDSSNRVLATSILYAGPDSGVFAQGLWPHRSRLFTPVNVGTSANPIFVSDYQITNAPSPALTIGTFIHELGHLLLGYPDLYDVGGGSSGIGQHCIMSSGNFNNNQRTPAPINAYFKEVSGWGDVTDYRPNDYFRTQLTSTGNKAIRIRKPGSTTEYFMIENRSAGDPWAAAMPDQGIVVWHIDETKFGNEDQEATPSNHFEVSLEQADGFFDLENGNNRGDSSDYYDNTTQSFNDTNTPTSKWWDGTSSNFQIFSNSPPGSSMEVTNGGLTPNSILMVNPNGGEAVEQGVDYEIIWDSTLEGNVAVKLELFQGGNFLQTIVEDEVDDGSYNWSVPSELASGSDYRIRVSSADGSISDTSDRNFSISSEFFPFNGQFPSGWTNSSGSVAWTVTDMEASSGDLSLAAGAIGNNQTSSTKVTLEVIQGKVSFDLKFNTQPNADYVEFYIDGLRRLRTSGVSDWQNYEFNVATGSREFEWRYKKNQSLSVTNEAVYLDQVVFPEFPAFGSVLVLAPNGGEEVAPGGDLEITWAANIDGPVKIELLLDDEFNLLIAENEPNDGSYQWTVPSTLEIANDFKVRISSFQDETSNDSSDGPFATLGEVFPPNGLLPEGWVQSPGANQSWLVTSEEAEEGGLSLVSGPIGNSQRAAIEYTDNFKDGVIQFAYKTTTQGGSFGDDFEFYIDGVRRIKASGTNDWNSQAFPISEGTHTFRWQYKKNGSLVGGFDKVWIDSVTLPPLDRIGPILTIRQGTDGDLLDPLEFSFPPAFVGTQTPPTETFTITNVGDLPLNDLTIEVGPDELNDFQTDGASTSSLGINESVEVEVSFSPLTPGLLQNIVTFDGSNLEVPVDFLLMGQGKIIANLTDWFGIWGLEGDSQLLSADDDGDGVSLLEEYAYNLNPTVSDKRIVSANGGIRGLPRVELVEMADGQSRLEAIFLKRKGDPSLVYTVEYGSSLDSQNANYFAPASLTPQATPVGVTHDRVNQADSEMTTTSGKRFGRVKVDHIPAE